MQHYADTILYKTHQHFIVPVLSMLSRFIPAVILIVLFGNFVFDLSIVVQISIIIIVGILIFMWYYYFWSKSYLLVTNEKLVKKVRNGLFSKFHMAIQYDNIRDIAYSKNNVVQYMFDCGSLFARSSAAAIGDFESFWTPNIERVYKIVSAINQLSPADRKILRSLDNLQSQGIVKDGVQDDVKKETLKKETIEEAKEKERNILLQIQGIKEVVVLTDADRRYIFEHEEDRNHGVYESLRRQILFAVTHDSTFREPDEAIVLQAGEKVVFPVIEFHEIKRKKVSSSSPGLEVHTYIAPKFQNLGDYDATLLIGFDI